MNLLERAEQIARQAHEGQFRRDGVTPYIAHPERVVARLRTMGITDEVTLAVAWLHDVVEDVDSGLDMIENADLPREVKRCAFLMSRASKESYESYLLWVKFNNLTRIVKIADILDNLSDAPTEKQIVKYAKALLYLHGQ